MIEVRQGTSKDIEQLVVLFEAYRNFYRQQPAKDQATQFLSERFINNDSVIFIAFDQSKNEAVGFTQLYPTFTSIRMKKSWILNDLFVSEKRRGHPTRIAPTGINRLANLACLTNLSRLSRFHYLRRKKRKRDLDLIEESWID